MKTGFRQFVSLKDRISHENGAEVVFYEHPEFEGASIPIRMEPSEYKKELPNLHLLPQNFGDSISAIKIEGWAILW